MGIEGSVKQPEKSPLTNESTNSRNEVVTGSQPILPSKKKNVLGLWRKLLKALDNVGLDIQQVVISYFNGDLGNTNISGSLRPELGVLKNLQYLELYSNNIEGKIPKELGNVENLVSMDLYGNKFEGNIPKSFAKLKSLRFLRLNDNKLTGSIPRELTTLPNLKVLGSAAGFKLDNLLKLNDTRSWSNRMTLMHYLCKYTC
ncbi:hypothetical protein P3S67_017899 [Capsicum chacoense]